MRCRRLLTAQRGLRPEFGNLDLRGFLALDLPALKLNLAGLDRRLMRHALLLKRRLVQAFLLVKVRL